MSFTESDAFKNGGRIGQSLGFTSEELKDDDDLKRMFRSIKSLALVPLDSVDYGWLEIETVTPGIAHVAHDALVSFKEYVINNWLENERTFPRRMWNHYRNFGARTTNHLEGWHRALNSVAKKKYLNIFEMVKCLQNQEAKYKILMLQLKTRLGPGAGSKMY